MTVHSTQWNHDSVCVTLDCCFFLVFHLRQGNKNNITIFWHSYMRLSLGGNSPQPT